MALEEAGVPTVAVHTDVFARLARAVAQANGMPSARQVFVPQPVVGRSAADLRAYIEGEDPVNGLPFLQVLVDGLTRPLDDRDQKGLTFDRQVPRLLEPDTDENLRRLFAESNWTDNLPIVLPTEELVEAMLAGTSHSRDEVVGRLRPTMYREWWEFTVEKVAVNAVMAGAKPEYFPVILALSASGISARSSSTTSFSTIALVNGPIRNEIGMNMGIGSMGPWNHANATIGRAYALLSQNLQGGSVPGETYMGSHGNWYSFSAAFAENEEQLPAGWEPFHVQHGYERDQSTATAFLGGWYTIYGTAPRETWEERFRLSLKACDPWLGPIIVLDPIGAQAFAELGFDTKEKLIDWCAENSLLPARDFWDNQWVQTLLRPKAALGMEPWASYLDVPPDEPVQLYQPEDISLVVTGGGTSATFKMIGGTVTQNRGAIVSVDAWR